MQKPWEALPEAFLERMKELVPEPYTRNDVLKGLSVRRPTTLRVNTIKATADELAKLLDEHHINFERVSWYSDAFIIRDFPLLDLTKLPFYEQGLCYVQSLSSMIPALVLDPQAGETVADLCAAPGSKTTQMAACMGNKGAIIANDTSHIRNFKLQANLERQGIKNTLLRNILAQKFWERYPEQFDRILVDVPCSMEGRFISSEPKTFIDWTPKKVKILASQQCWMLRSAVSAAKVGATIVYSTCTLSPEENEGVIDWILKKEKAHVVVEDITFAVDGRQPGIKQWGNKIYHPDVQKAMRIYPTNLMEGFFVAKLKKVQANTTPKNF